MSKKLAGGESLALIPEEFSETRFSLCEIYYMAPLCSFRPFFFIREGCTKINKRHRGKIE